MDLILQEDLTVYMSHCKEAMQKIKYVQFKGSMEISQIICKQGFTCDEHLLIQIYVHFCSAQKQIISYKYAQHILKLPKEFFHMSGVYFLIFICLGIISKFSESLFLKILLTSIPCNSTVTLIDHTIFNFDIHSRQFNLDNNSMLHHAIHL